MAALQKLQQAAPRAGRGILLAVGIVGAVWFLSRMFGKKLPSHKVNEADISGAGPAAKEAAEFYESIQWGNKPDKVLELGDMKPPKWLIEVGDLRSVVYDSKKSGKKEGYEHHFKRPYPKLATDSKGEKLYVAGGGFHTNWRGIVG